MRWRTAVAVVAILAGCEPSPEPAARTIDRPASPQVRTLRVAVWSETTRPSAGTTEVWLRGFGSWGPQLRHGADVRNYPRRPVGATDTLYFYPHGRGGPEVVVPVPITMEMCPDGCVRDAVNLEIHDDRVEVWGGLISESTYRLSP